MAFRDQPDETQSISLLVSKLRDEGHDSDVDQVEEKLVVREMRLKRDHEKQMKEWEEKLQSERVERLKVEDEMRVWKEKYEKLQSKRVERLNKVEDEMGVWKEKYEKLQSERVERMKVEDEMRIWKEKYEKLQSERVERLKVEDEMRVWKEKYENLLEKAKRRRVDADEQLILKLKRKNKILHRKNMKLLRELESAMSKLADENQKMMNIWGINITGGRTDNGEGRTDKGVEESAPVLELERGFDSAQVTEGKRDPKKSSGIGNVFSDAIVIIDSDDECALGHTLYGKKNSEKHERNGFLSVAGVAKEPQMLKRKQAPSPSIGNNENDDEDFVLDQIPISEIIKQRKKLSLAPSSSLVTGKDVSSAISGHGKQANQSSRDRVILRQSEEEKRKKQKPSPISLKSHAKERYHTFGNSDSYESSSKSDYEEIQSLFNDLFRNAKE